MVVQLAADPAAFLFLRMNQAAGELFDGLFREPALGDLALELLVAAEELRGPLLDAHLQFVTRLLKRVLGPRRTVLAQPPSSASTAKTARRGICWSVGVKE